MTNSFILPGTPVAATALLCGFLACSGGGDSGDPECPRMEFEEGRVVQSQEELDQLDGVTRIAALYIQLYEITDLSPLRCLERVDGSLGVTFTNLEDLSGLERLRFVGESLDVGSNDQLRSTAALESLESVGNFLGVADNPLLADLSGFTRIRELQALTIDTNHALTNLDELANLERVTRGSVFIRANLGLETVSGMTSLTYAHDGLSVAQNAALVPCDDWVLAARVETWSQHYLQTDPALCDGAEP